MDWKPIKREYIAGGTSYRKLSIKYNIPVNTIQKVAKREQWLELRKQTELKSNAKIIEIESDKQAERMNRLFTVTDKLLEAVEEAVNSFKTNEMVLEKSALKSLSSTIKDIKDIQSLKTTLDIEEQKARIALLKKQAEKDNDTSHEVIVKISEDLEEYSE